MRLDKEYYKKNAVELAPALLGKLLCRRCGEDILKYRITETECYFGEEDTACHAHRGKTERTKILYRDGGYAYVYLCYGIHSLLNVVSGAENHPEAVLIRGIEGYTGPGRLTKHLNITRSLNGEDLCTSDELWIEDDGFATGYKASRRIGIDYATEEDRNRLWRLEMI